MSVTAIDSKAIPNRIPILFLLVLLCAAIRVGLWQIYEPGTSPDTGTYVELASQIASSDFTSYMGRRTPMYPLLLVAAQLDYGTVWIIQSVLGIGISMLLYLLVLEWVDSVPLAFVVGLLHSLTLNVLFFESKILSETLATFLVAASVLLFVRMQKAGNSPGKFVLVGLCVAATTLTRPQYVYLAPLFVLLMLLTAGGRRGRNASLIAAFLVAFALPVAGWAAFNKAHLGYFGLTTQMGLSLAQHSGKFIDKAPDEFAQVRDIYMRHRALMPPDADHMTVWEAVPDMLAETGLSFLDLNRQLTRLSLTLFVHHPILYARSVLDAWVGFWPVPNIWNPELIRGSGLRRALERSWTVQHALLRGMNLAFFLFAIALGPREIRRSFKDGEVSVFLVVASVVLGGSLVQALLEATDNARYSIPTQPLVALFVIVVIFEFARSRMASRRHVSAG